jgi:putative transposase
MARPLRVEYPGAFYHVINRGNAGEDIFINNRDREKFLEYLEKAIERFDIKIHTYCLMTTHYHLLVETPQPNLSQAIKWINVSYAGYFNRKRQRRGHLFQGRFKSILVDADEYLKQLSRYIHLNPMRAKMVDKLSSYPWSSYPFFIGKKKAPNWLETDWLLSLFGKRRKVAAEKYQDFVEKINMAEVENPAGNLVGGFILGSSDFVNWVKETFLAKCSEKRDIPQLTELKPRLSADQIVAAVCDEFDCDTDLILQKGRKKNVVRDVAIYLSRDFTGDSGVDLGKYFGNISGAGITVRYNHLAKQIQINHKLRRRIKRIKNKIIKI